MGTFTTSTTTKENFSYKKIEANEKLEIPVKQQMVTIGDLKIDANGELILLDDSEVAIIEG
jgi:hypothetical protein